jgi:hypothetical protein
MADQGKARTRGMFDGPQPAAADMPKELVEIQAAAAAQDDRYDVMIKYLSPLGLLEITKRNKHVQELRHETLYLSYPVLLKMAGTILGSIDVGEVRQVEGK